ncbi:MAG: acyltransferase [Verrucomicrobiaceae bacterium]|nr:acyltransferase [Verrucomicrobiaceae bacterium]
MADSRQPVSSESISHLWQVDALRAAAISMVLVYHCFRVPRTGYVSEAIVRVTGSLWCGVDLFFALSGFLITTILIRTHDQHGRYKNFIARRSLRIFPLFYAWLAIFYICAPWIGVNDMHGMGLAAPWAWTYTFNWFIAKIGGYPADPVIDHIWSLAVEEQFYLVWPVLVFLCKPRWIGWLAGGGVLTAWGIKLAMWAGGSPWEVIHTQTYTRMDGLLAGGLVAWLRIYHWESWVVRNALLWALVLSASGLLALGAWHGHLWPAEQTAVLATLFYSVFFAALLAFCVRGGATMDRLRPLLDNDLVRWIAKLSYGIYLSHWILWRWFAAAPDAWNSVWWQKGIAVVSLSVLVSFLLYRLLEVPFLRMKRFF